MKKKQKNLGAYLLLASAGIKFITDTALILAILALLILFGLQFPHISKWDTLWLVHQLHRWGDPALAWVASRFGWTWPELVISLLPIGCGFAALVLKIVFDAAMVQLSRLIQKKLPLPEESLELSASASSQGISVSSTLLAMAAVSQKAMDKIRRRYARVEQRLNEAKRRHCAFLSIAVVDSVQMKEEPDPEKVARSFGAYERMLEGIFRDTGAWKEAWTPDGVMVCYLEGRHALDAARRVLHGLEDFNARFNELPEPFRVCCGINEGEVAIFEDSKLQKVADRVIDVAGHMQKNARPNTLWLSSEVYDRLEEKLGFSPVNAQVDGFRVYEWSVSERMPSSRTAA